MRLKVLLFVCVMLVNTLATNPAKPETPRLPWLFSPGIVDELMVHTAVPEATARLIFEETRKAPIEAPSATEGRSGQNRPRWRRLRTLRMV